MPEPMNRLLAIMARLRDPRHGCDWDTAQTFETIAPYTIEEAYEVADAIARGNLEDLRGELGDLLLQVVFHARMAEEAGAFAFADVANSINEKMEARHPHIFGPDISAGPSRAIDDGRWESLKASERESRGETGVLDGIALALPALLRAQKLQQRAARTGFDWPDKEGPRQKVLEEIEELEGATSDGIKEEAGDFLFAAVNLVRAYGIDAESALRAANAKFERRFRAMEDLAEGNFAARTLDEQEDLWRAVKRAERS